MGITNLKDNVAATLALDVEYRIHEIIQVERAFKKHPKVFTKIYKNLNYTSHRKRINLCVTQNEPYLREKI